jgi:hypothetical protein
MEVGDRGRINVLEKLDNNEAVLLMYLAGELPVEDRAEIERMLAGDVSLRKQLAMLRLAQEATDCVFTAMDAVVPVDGRAALSPGSMAEAAAIRRISRSMRSHLTRQIAQRPVAPAKRGLRFPWWAYPTAATAASVLAVLVWWANNSGNSPLYIPSDKGVLVGQNMAMGPGNEGDPQVRQVTRFWQQGEDARQDQIDADERTQAQELATITNASDDDAAVWKVGNSDAQE